MYEINGRHVMSGPRSMGIAPPSLSQWAPRRGRLSRYGLSLAAETYVSPSTASVDPSIQQQFFPVVNKTGGFTQLDLSQFLEVVANRAFLTAQITGIDGCTYAAQPVSAQTDAALVSTIGQTSAGALAAVSATLVATGAISATTAGAILGPIGLAVGAIIGLIVELFAKKAALERTEDQTLCALLISVNQSLAAIDAGLMAGALTSAQANSLFTTLIQQFTSAAQSEGIIRDLPSAGNTTSCDASCELLRDLEGICAQRTIDMKNDPPPADPQPAVAVTAASASAVPSTATSIVQSVETAVASTGIPVEYLVLGGLALWLMFS